MSDEFLLLLALITATLGMASLSLSISAHWRQLFDQRQQSSSMRTILRAAGFSLIAVSFLICTAADPFMMAILVWPMLLLVGAALVAAGLTMHARMRRAAGAPRDLHASLSGTGRKGEL